MHQNGKMNKMVCGKSLVKWTLVAMQHLVQYQAMMLIPHNIDPWIHCPLAVVSKIFEFFLNDCQ